MQCLFTFGSGQCPWVFEEHHFSDLHGISEARLLDVACVPTIQALERIRAICKRNRVRTPNKKRFWIQPEIWMDLDDLVWLCACRRHGKGIPGVLDRSCMYLVTWPCLLTRVVHTVIYDGSYYLVWTGHQRLCSWKFFFVWEWLVCISIRAGKRFELPVVRHGRLKKSESKNAFWTSLPANVESNYPSPARMICLHVGWLPRQATLNNHRELTWSAPPNHIRIQPLPAICDVAPFWILFAPRPQDILRPIQ